MSLLLLLVNTSVVASIVPVKILTSSTEYGINGHDLEYL